MSLASGDRLGPYEIVGPLAKGGMGEVYRARDTRLGREVAIKILPSNMAADPQAVARFDQEARAVAALSHPHILAIHDIGQQDGTAFAVTELLEGETLRDRMSAGRLPIRKAVDFASQIAQGLAAAHAKGIVHRDIKPENIFISSDGHAKVLDFGLAKIQQAAPSDLTTVAGSQTDPGTVLGTTGYLSPEQAQAKPVDARSDTFSFGAVLYEMLTGRRAFKGDSTIDTLHSIVHDHPPPIDTAAPDVPHELRWVLDKCLAKDPDERYQSTRDLVVDLKAVARSLDSSPKLPVTSPVAAGGKRLGRWIPIAVAGAVVAIIAAALLIRRGAPAEAPGAAAAKISFERITSLGTVIDAAVSPDGKYVAYVTSENARQGLSLRQVATASTIELVPPRSVGFWGITFSPDGNAVYYAEFSRDEPTRAIYRIPALGGTPRKLVTGADSQPSFSPDGRQMTWVRGEYPDPGTSSLMVADADGQNARVLATKRSPEFFVPIFFTAPAWSPDGTMIVCPMERRGDATVGTLLAYRPADGSEAPFPHHEWPGGIGQVVWTSDGQGLITVGTAATGRNQLWWVSAHGAERHQITNDLLDYRKASLTSDASELVTVAAESAATMWVSPIDGAADPIRISNGRYDGVSGIARAPGGRVLYRSLESGTAAIWVMDEDGGNRRQLTAEGVSSWPVASADGKSAIFSREGLGLWQIGLDGQGARQIDKTPDALYPEVTPDGQSIVYSSASTGVEKLWRAPAAGGSPVKILDTYADRPAVSPDGKQLAFYYRDRPDAVFGLAVMPIDGSKPTATFRVAPSLAYAAVRWTADGRALLHNSGIGDRANIWLQPLDGSPAKKITHFADLIVQAFDRSADGKKLLIARGALTRDAVLIRNFR